MQAVNSRRRWLGGVLLLVLAGAVWQAGAELLRYGDDLVRRFELRTQRTLAFDGAPAVSLWPRFALRVGRVRLSERGGKGEFLSFRELRLQPRLIPLIAGRIEIDRVEIDDLRVNLVRWPDGRLNIDDLLAADAPAGSAFRLEQLVLNGAEVAWRDADSGRSIVVRKLDLHAGELGRAASGRLELAGELAGAPEGAGFAVRLTSRYRYDLGGAGAQRWQIEDAAGRLDGPLTDGRQIELRLQVPRLASTAGRIEGDALGLTARLSGGGARLAAGVRLRGISGGGGTFAVTACEVDAEAVPSGIGTVRYAARLSSPLRGSIAAQRIDFPAITGRLGIKHPALLTALDLPVDAALHLAVTAQGGRLELSGRIDESRIGLRGALEGWAAPVFDVDATMDRLDVDRYLAPSSAQGRGPEPAGPPVSPVADGLRGQGTIRIGTLRLGGIEFAGVEFDVSLNNGRFESAERATRALRPGLAPVQGGIVTDSGSGGADGHRERQKR